MKIVFTPSKSVDAGNQRRQLRQGVTINKYFIIILLSALPFIAGAQDSTVTFRIKKLPDPVLIVNGKDGGFISRYDMYMAGQASLRFKPAIPGKRASDYFTIIDMTMAPPDDGKHDAWWSTKSGTFSQSMLNLISCTRVKTIYIYKIKVKGKDGTVRHIKNAEFRITDPR